MKTLGTRESEAQPKTVCQQFRQSVSSHEDSVLLHHRGRDWTYSQIEQAAMRVCRHLRGNGLAPNDRVAILLRNSFEYVTAYYGCLLNGNVVVPLNPDTTVAELGRTLVHCEPSAIIYAPPTHELLTAVAGDLPRLRCTVVDSDASIELKRNLCHHSFRHILRSTAEPTVVHACRPGDIAQIIYTSGTTGHPKGVTLSHQNLVANTRSINEYLQLNASDSVLVVLPFFYSYGNSLLHTHVAAGGRLVLASDFTFWNRVVDLMEQQRVTGFSGVPSTYAMLVHKSRFLKMSFSALRYLTCAGGGLAPAATHRLRHAFPHIRLFLMYGQTEATARLSTLLPEEVDRKPGSIGKGIPGVELTIRDKNGDHVPFGVVGEITAKGNNIMVGYWKNPEATAEVIRDGRLHTGDLAWADDDGFIFIAGRSSDMIKAGAYRVDPKEVEEAITELDDVVEVAVVGVPDDIHGSTIVAYIVRHEASTLDSDQVAAHCRRALPRYKRPREVVFVKSIPKTASGKVQRHRLTSPDQQALS